MTSLDATVALDDEDLGALAEIREGIEAKMSRLGSTKIHGVKRRHLPSPEQRYIGSCRIGLLFINRKPGSSRRRQQM